MFCVGIIQPIIKVFPDPFSAKEFVLCEPELKKLASRSVHFEKLAPLQDAWKLTQKMLYDTLQAKGKQKHTPCDIQWDGIGLQDFIMSWFHQKVLNTRHYYHSQNPPVEAAAGWPKLNPVVDACVAGVVWPKKLLPPPACFPFLLAV